MFNPNSFFMYACVAVLIGYVTLQSVFFLVKAIRRAHELGIQTTTVKKIIASSAIFTIAPAISILMGILTLAGFLGIPLPWFRLSVLGAITYELTAAYSAAKTLNIKDLSTLITDPQVFSTIMWVMHVGISISLVLIPLFLRKLQQGLVSIRTKDEKWSDMFLSALFLGMISAFLGLIFTDIKTGLVGWIPVFVMLVSSFIMVLLGFFIKKLKIHWLQDFALPISMLASMTLAIPITNFVQTISQ